MILAVEIALAVGYGVLAHLASARGSHALALMALLSLVLLMLASPMAARHGGRPRNSAVDRTGTLQ